MSVEAEEAVEPALLVDGRRVRVPTDGLTLGRSPACDVCVDDPEVSRRHAVVRPSGDGLELEDCGSVNGTWVNEEQVRSGTAPLHGGDVITVAQTQIRVLAGAPTRAAPASTTDAGAWSLQVQDGCVTVGRAAANDVVLEDPNVSRFHAELRRDGERVLVRDLGSRNGTWVDGRRVHGTVAIAPGESVRVGPFAIVPSDGCVERSSVCLQADEVAVGEILAPTSLSIRAGELVAVIGRSGSGKTTLLRALAGVTAPTAGEVRLDGEPVANRTTEVGYLPQDEIVHPQLTTREALRYAARLRLPRDTAADELEQLVEQTLGDLSLSGCADRRIARLSGGERKRAGLAVELLGRPSVLFLDEPTTGLDPGLEAQTMELLRRLADGDRAVVVVTHATGSLDLCDRVAVMGPGGRLHYLGKPSDALEHFGVDGFEGIYDAVAEAEPPTTPPGTRSSGSARTGSPPRPVSGRLAQASVLTRRYARVFSRDRRNLILLLAQVPLLGLAIGMIFGHDVFLRTRRGNPNDAAQVLFLLSTTAIWLGTIAAAREVVKERAVVVRERAAGIGLGAYLASKMAVLFTLVALQAAALTGAVVALRPLHEGPGGYATVFALVVATAITAAAMGLALSALARSEDQAMSFIPLSLVPQLLFAGALVPVTKMGGVLQAISALAPSRWSFAGLGSAADLAGRLKADPYDARYSPFKRSFFDVGLVEALALLGAFTAVFLLVTAFALRRRRG